MTGCPNIGLYVLTFSECLCTLFTQKTVCAFYFALPFPSIPCSLHISQLSFSIDRRTVVWKPVSTTRVQKRTCDFISPNVTCSLNYVSHCCNSISHNVTYTCNVFISFTCDVLIAQSDFTMRLSHNASLFLATATVSHNSNFIDFLSCKLTLYREWDYIKVLQCDILLCNVTLYHDFIPRDCDFTSHSVTFSQCAMYSNFILQL